MGFRPKKLQQQLDKAFPDVVRIDIDYDDSPEDPCDWAGSWKVYSFLSDHAQRDGKGYDDFFEDGEPIEDELRQKLKDGLAFVLDYFEHGQGNWSLRGEGTQCRWDTSHNCGIMVWEEPADHMGAKTYEERAEDARRHLEVYNNWCNGLVYGYTIETFGREELDSCWGYYSDKDVIDAINETLGWVKEQLGVERVRYVLGGQCEDLYEADQIEGEEVDESDLEEEYDAD